jgi:hypothetical protein
MADFQWKGGWLGDPITGSTIPYGENNNVTHNGIYYICTSFAEVGSPSPDMDTQHWDVILRDGLSGSSGQAGSSGTSGIDGSSAAIQKHWFDGFELVINSGDIVTIGSDYVIRDSALFTEAPGDDGYGSSITIAGKTYNRDGKLTVLGDFVVYDSFIDNDGEIKVDGGLILEGDTVIEGDGIII